MCTICNMPPSAGPASQVAFRASAGEAREAGEALSLNGASDRPPAELSETTEAANKQQAAVFWFGALAVVSVWMMIGNKLVMTVFHYPNFITMLQNSTAVVCLMVGNKLGWIPMRPMTAVQWKVFIGTAVLLVMQIVSSLLALPRVAVATTIAFRNLATCLTAILEATFFGKTFSTESVMAMVVTVLGMGIYAGFDINYDFMGYFWLGVNTLATVANMLYNRFYIAKYTQSKEQTPEGISFTQQVETLPLVFTMVSACLIPRLKTVIEGGGLQATYNDEWTASAELPNLTSSVLVQR